MEGFCQLCSWIHHHQTKWSKHCCFSLDSFLCLLFGCFVLLHFVLQEGEMMVNLNILFIIFLLFGVYHFDHLFHEIEGLGVWGSLDSQFDKEQSGLMKCHLLEAAWLNREPNYFLHNFGSFGLLPLSKALLGLFLHLSKFDGRSKTRMMPLSQIGNKLRRKGLTWELELIQNKRKGILEILE